ncbi:MAG: NADH:flavin oxidoreductases, Old Yellow Enzyme family [uncultured Paraburkholderia sp.]|nr:MAG: NADH:flavin oxidoreductases, Old Yellow Enzyme family [uncultured Paraburkholderia sp.]
MQLFFGKASAPSPKVNIYADSFRSAANWRPHIVQPHHHGAAYASARRGNSRAERADGEVLRRARNAGLIISEATSVTPQGVG